MDENSIKVDPLERTEPIMSDKFLIFQLIKLVSFTKALGTAVSVESFLFVKNVSD